MLCACMFVRVRMRARVHVRYAHLVVYRDVAIAPV